MGMISEFKKFAMRGNVLDLAVGIIIGGAFGKIVSSFVADVLMPPIGLLLGRVNFADLAITLKAAGVDEAGKETAAVLLKYGSFIQTIVDFTIIAFSVFLLIKVINNLQKKEEAAPAAPAAPPAPSNEEKLLGEIRDLLKAKS
ncbi:MAG: large-conductance mechanosensitive channel protein MscL [Candidatus Sumerlaeia bacterium]|nr:large-conductance mechanosensitive channel protein MscL [Candidatus Sumerlaeia bacterium]